MSNETPEVDPIDEGTPVEPQASVSETDDESVNVDASGDSTPEFMPDYGPVTNVSMGLGSPYSKEGKKAFPENSWKIPLPSVEREEYRTATTLYKNLKIPLTNEDIQNWANAFDQSRFLFMAGDAFTESLANKDRGWSQEMTVGTERIRADRPRFGDGGGDRVSGEEARLRVRAAISAGASTRVPLWHSGIWVTIKAPTETELMDLDAAISREKISMGWGTRGLVFSAYSGYISDALATFILEHVSATSYQESSVNALKEIISQPDYMQLVWGMLCSIYTDGYPYEQPCMLDPTKCTHREQGRLNFGKMSYMDDRALNDWQRQHMRKRNAGSQSKLDVQRYQSEHAFNKNNVIVLNENLSVELRVPNLQEYLDSTRNWIDGLIESVDSAFGVDLPEKDRNARVQQRASLSIMQQYAHWIRIITLTESNKHIDDRETINDTIADLTSDEEIFKNFFDGVRKYIDSIVLCVHGIPKYPCPSCKGEPPEQILKHPKIFPIDLAETFFILVGQRLQRMLNRQE